MTSEEGLLQCYNRGCGQKYNPQENKEDSCQHHPGEPFFHDAYKGWTCCNKKCTDFTEFLNIKGCTKSQHSNEKPPEPEKPCNDNIPDTDIIEVKPIVKSSLTRPPFETPLVTMQPEVAPSLKHQKFVQEPIVKNNISDEVTVGTTCKNSGCNVVYEGPVIDETPCIHHPGYPVFHEGLKFWSCCTKRTSDFNAFLEQIGCETGKHVWIKYDANPQAVQCRWDYHQTGTHVIVSIYAKNYCPTKSEVKLNPIRLCTKVVFPQQENASFNLDLELRGVINVNQSQVNMFGTKVEIKLRKAEPGSWSRLEIPREIVEENKKEQIVSESLEERVESVDLSDL